MPQWFGHRRPCKDLSALAQATLAKHLLRAFFVLGKAERKIVSQRPTTDILGDRQSPIQKMIFEKRESDPLEQLRSYLSPKLPDVHQQSLFDSVFTLLSTPEFDENDLINCLEFKFQILDVIASTSDMSHIVEKFLKCLLFNYVRTLDFSNLYMLESCWMARARRVFYATEKDNLGKAGSGEESRNSERLDSLWKDLMEDHGQAVSVAATASAPNFKQMTSINIDFVATGELVWAIGCNCPLLNELSLYIDSSNRSRYSVDFENRLIGGLSSLHGNKKYVYSGFPGRPVGCPKLERVTLPSVALDRQSELEEAAARLVYYLPHLNELHNVSTTSVLMNMLKDESVKYRSLALTNVDEARLDVTIKEICHQAKIEPDFAHFLPNVTSARVLHNKKHGGLKGLPNYPNVKILEVNSVDGSELEFGTNFSKLTHFRNNCKWDEKKLAGFSNRAPNLEGFFFLSGSLHKLKKCKVSMSFPKLRLLKVYEMTHIESEPFVSFVRSTKVLTHLIIENGEKTEDLYHSVFKAINDRVIAAILPALKKLVIFHARVLKYRGHVCYDLTLKSARALISGCPKLKEIGSLFHWNVPALEVVAFKREAKETNLDVLLLPDDDDHELLQKVNAASDKT